MTRLTLLRIATALLYVGPLLAGLAGFGWALVPVFALLAMLALLFLKPETWPGGNRFGPFHLSDLTFAAQGPLQLFLVTVSFAAGRGIAEVTGYQPAMSFWLPVAVSVASILLGRLVWNPDAVPKDGSNDP